MRISDLLGDDGEEQEPPVEHRYEDVPTHEEAARRQFGDLARHATPDDAPEGSTPPEPTPPPVPPSAPESGRAAPVAPTTAPEPVEPVEPREPVDQQEAPVELPEPLDQQAAPAPPPASATAYHEWLRDNDPAALTGTTPPIPPPGETPIATTSPTRLAVPSDDLLPTSHRKR